MEKDGQKVWATILSEIKTQISNSSFRTWFLGSHAVDFKTSDRGDHLVVGVKNNFLKEQLETKYSDLISSAAKQKRLSTLGITFVVAQNKVGQTGTSEPLFTGQAPQFLSMPKRADALNSAHTFDNFVVGSSNNIAYLCAKQVVDSLGQVYNPLLIWGPTGVGKTHLLQAIGNFVNDRVHNAKILYATSEKFTNDYIESIGNRSGSMLRQRYRTVDLLLVDDVHFLGGKESTQDEFFHTFNELVLSGRQVVLTSDRHPREIPRLKERLLSRLVGGMTADISYPDVEQKMAIIKQKCREREVSLDDDVIFNLAGSSFGGVRELEGLLIAILAKMRLSGSSVDLGYVKSLIEKTAKNKKQVTIGDISQAVSRHFKVSESQIRGKGRKALVVVARQVLMYLLRIDLGLSFEAIGDFVGGRDHSTVIYGVGKMEKIIVNNSSIKDEVLRIKSLVES